MTNSCQHLLKISPIFVIVLVLTIPILTLAGEGRPPPLVYVTKVIEKKLDSSIDISARLVARSVGNVSARVAGIIESIEIDIGDEVEKGQIIAQILDDRLIAERNQARGRLAAANSRLASAKAAITLAKQELTRLEKLRKSAAFSKARYDDKLIEIDNLSAAIDTVKGDIQVYKAALDDAGIVLDWATVKAPHHGIITRRHLVQGSWAGLGAPIVELMDNHNIEIEADIPASYSAYINHDNTFSYRFEHRPDTWQAHLRVIIPRENTTTRTQLARFTLAPKAPESIVANRPVIVTIPTSQRQMALLVPKDALLTTTDGTGMVRYRLFIVIDNTARMKNITVGPSVGHEIAVTSGVTKGDIVIIRGNERLRDGQAVRFEQ